LNKTNLLILAQNRLPEAEYKCISNNKICGYSLIKKIPVISTGILAFRLMFLEEGEGGSELLKTVELLMHMRRAHMNDSLDQKGQFLHTHLQKKLNVLLIFQ